MDCGNAKKARTDVEVDRISSLSDDLIHKILSFVDVKDVVETSALSSRWRFIWTRLPYLNFSTESFSTSHMFSKFVTHVLSRNGETYLFSVKLFFHEKSCEMSITRSNQVSIERIQNNALSRNVQKLTITFLLVKCIMSLPLIFKSKFLKHLCLEGFSQLNTDKLTSIWHLPALTTLNLYGLNLDNSHYVLALSPNLKILILGCCQVTESDGFCITNLQLLTLTLKNVTWHVKFVRVDTPKLKTLRINELPKELTVSAPDLTYLRLKGSYLRGHQLRLSVDGLERADLCMSFPDETETNALRIVVLLQHLHSVKFIALNMEIVEEARTIEITKLAKSSMARLEGVLEKVQNNIKNNRACMEQQMAQVENQREVAGWMTGIMRKWGYFDVKMEQGREDIGRIIGKVEEIKGLLTKVLA